MVRNKDTKNKKTSRLNAGDPMERLRVLDAIENEDVTEELVPKLRHRLAVENDRNVFVRLLLVISSIIRNSRDREVVMEVRDAGKRLEPLMTGTN